MNSRGIPAGLLVTLNTSLQYGVGTRQRQHESVPGAFLLSGMNASELPLPSIISERWDTVKQFLTVSRCPHTETGQNPRV